MTNQQKAERVGAIQKADEENVYFFGWGEHVGDTVPSRGFLAELEIPNPTILLDNGDTVYGFECWWGDEERIKEMIGSRNVIMVGVPDES